MFAVRIYGYGGQGSITIAETLAVAAFSEGKYALAFPGLRTERAATPMVTCCRIDEIPVIRHAPVLHPDAVIVQDMALLTPSPFDPQLLNKAWAELEEKVRAALPASLRDADVALDRFVEMRYRQQVNELTVPAPSGDYTGTEVDTLIRTFEREYELLFGAGSGYPKAGFMITSLRVTARARVTEHEFVSTESGNPFVVEPTASREVVWYELGAQPRRTPVFNGSRLVPGDRVIGEAIIEFIDTTIVLRRGQQATVDTRSSIVIEPNTK